MVNLEALYINLRKHLHYVYLLYAIPMVYMAATITPPYQNPDEPNHFLRAEQVTRGIMMPVFKYDTAKLSRADSLARNPLFSYPDRGGFSADKGIFEAETAFVNAEQKPDVKIDLQKVKECRKVNWGTGIVYLNFGNTAIYPPIVYLMPALGIAIGKLFNLSILNTMSVARVLNGALSIAMCFFALTLAKRSKVLLFIVLLFPMTIALFASISQDPFLISCAFLLTAIIDNVEFDENKSYSKWQIYAIIILISIIGVAKPPYILLGFVLLFLKLSPKIKILSIGVPIVVLASWLIVNHAAFMIKFAPAEMGFNPKLQVAYIIHHPFKFIGLFFNWSSKGVNFFSHMFVGVLGWLDLSFTNVYYVIAYITLFSGLIVSSGLNGYNNLKVRIVLLVAFVMTFAAILTAQYVTWTKLESTFLDGMQGRYLTPAYPFLALALSSSITFKKMQRLKNVLFIVVLTFPIFTALNMVDGYIKRYYLR